MLRTKLPAKTKRVPYKWTKTPLKRLNQVLEILDEFDEFKPLTIRQIYYQMVGKGHIKNSISMYNTIGKLLKFARIDGYIDYSDIEDRTRAEYDLTGWGNRHDYINAELDFFLTRYSRDLMQTQDVYIELWIEKNALSSIFTKVAKDYGIRVQVTQNNSISRLYEYKKRLKLYPDKEPILLFFSDFDPQGDNMLNAMKETMIREMGIVQIKEKNFKQVALKKGDIEKYNLFKSIDAIKPGDKLAKRFRAKYGGDVIPAELDAIPPLIMENIIRDAIEKETDIEKFHIQKSLQDEDYSIIKDLKGNIMKNIKR